MTTAKPISIYTKLLEVRKSVPYLKKDHSSSQFTYNSSSQVLGAVRQKLDELGVLLVTKILDKKVNAREKANAKGGISITYEVDLDLEFTWVNTENPSETLIIPWFAMGLDTGDNAKAIGKALTYAEKYFMLKQFNIATDNDDADKFQEKADGNIKENPEPEDILLLTDKISEFASLRKQTIDAVHKALAIKDVNKLSFQQMSAHHITLDTWINGAKKQILEAQQKQAAATGA